jgi:hypothetical protein
MGTPLARGHPFDDCFIRLGANGMHEPVKVFVVSKCRFGPLSSYVKYRFHRSVITHTMPQPFETTTLSSIAAKSAANGRES